MNTPSSARRSPGRPKAEPGRSLRLDLLNASRKLLDEGGPGALSMREVARRLGCTHQAPYNYFADRESLLAALVGEGFERLAQRLSTANALALTDGVRAVLIASGMAYIDFALSHPGVFRIMFRPDVCNPARFPDLQRAGLQAHAELVRLHAIVYGEGADVTLATILWAHVHGLACLLVDGPLSLHFGNETQRSAHVLAVGNTFADLVLRPDLRPAG